MHFQPRPAEDERGRLGIPRGEGGLLGGDGPVHEGEVPLRQRGKTGDQKRGVHQPLQIDVDDPGQALVRGTHDEHLAGLKPYLLAEEERLDRDRDRPLHARHLQKVLRLVGNQGRALRRDPIPVRIHGDGLSSKAAALGGDEQDSLPQPQVISVLVKA